MSVAASSKSVYWPSLLPPSLVLWSLLVVVWLVVYLQVSSLDLCKFFPGFLGGRPSLFGPRPSGLNFFLFLFSSSLVFSSIMGSRNFTRTLSVDVSCFMESHSREDVAKLIHGKYHENFGTPTIQILPRGIARITFRDAAAKQNLLRHDKISLGGRSCKIFAERRFVTVQVHHYPSEAFDCHVEKVLMGFGTVKGVKRQHWVGLPDIQTGTRLVDIFLDKHVPRNLVIGGFNCKTWYRGQPVTCDLCGEIGHVLSQCPIRGKCRRCREPGHLARDCNRPAWDARDPPPDVGSANAEPTPAEAAASSAEDLRDNQLDELDSQVFADALSAVSSSSSGEESEDEADCGGEDEPAMGDGCESSDSTLGDAGSIDSGVIPKQGDDGTQKQVNVDNVSESTLDNISINNEQVNDNESTINGNTINGNTLKQLNVSDGTIKGNTLKQVNVSESTLNNNGTSNDNSPLNNNSIGNITLNNNGINNDNSDNSAPNASETTLKQFDGASVAPSKLVPESSGVAVSAEMDYESVKGSKRPANDDGSSDDPSPSWEDVVVSEEVANAAPRLSVVQGPALRKKTKPSLTLARKGLSAAVRAAADETLFKAGRPRRQSSKHS